MPSSCHSGSIRPPWAATKVGSRSSDETTSSICEPGAITRTLDPGVYRPDVVLARVGMGLTVAEGDDPAVTRQRHV